MKESRRLEWLKFLVPTAVAIFSAYYTYQNGQEVAKLDARVEEYRQSENLSKMIIDGMEDFHKEVPSYPRLRFIAIYRMAQSDDDKIMLSRIAIDGQFDELFDQVLDYLDEDFSERCVTQESDLCEKYNKARDDLSVNSDKAIEIARANNVKAEDKEYLKDGKIDVPTLPLEKLKMNGSSQVEPQTSSDTSRVEGWIYLGKTEANTNTLSGTVTTKFQEIPQENASAATKTSVTFRSTAGTKNNKVYGYLIPGTEVKVLETEKFVLREGGQGVWAKVSISKGELSVKY